MSVEPEELALRMGTETGRDVIGVLEVCRL
jgi:hypothetical protein